MTSKESRILTVILNDAQIIEESKTMSSLIEKRNEIDEEKKRITKEMGDEMKGYDLAIGRMAKIVTEGKAELVVAVEIEYHKPARNMKRIVRMDTYEVVEEVDMTERDFEKVAELSQLTLALN